MYRTTTTMLKKQRLGYKSNAMSAMRHKDSPQLARVMCRGKWWFVQECLPVHEPDKACDPWFDISGPQASKERAIDTMLTKYPQRAG